MRKRFVDWAKKNGWVVKMCRKRKRLCDEILERYPNIPKEYRDFIEFVDELSAFKDTLWFITPEEYSGEKQRKVPFDECEKRMIKMEKSYPLVKREVIDFWDTHLPIVLYKGYYLSYYAISMNDGSVVYSFDPWFTEPEVVAQSFENFLEKVVSGEWEI